MGKPAGDLLPALEQLAGRTPRAADHPRALADAILATLATEDSAASVSAGRMPVPPRAGRADANHPAGSLPDLADVEPDDTGNVIDGASMALIATAGEWAVYARLHAALTGPGERSV